MLRDSESPEKIQDIKNKVQVFDQGMRALLTNAANTSKEDLRLAEVSATAVARYKKLDLAVKKNMAPQRKGSVKTPRKQVKKEVGEQQLAKQFKRPPKQRATLKGSLKDRDSRDSPRTVQQQSVPKAKAKAKARPNHTGALPENKAERETVRKIDETLDGYALAHMEANKRNEIEDLLSRYDLSIDAARGLEYRCSFKPISIPGYRCKTLEFLEEFLAKNPGNHLAIFSVERKALGLCCFYIDDLMQLLRVKSRSPTHGALKQLNKEYWDTAHVNAGGITLGGAEILLAIQWADAYAKFKVLLENEMTPEIYASLLKVSTAIVPTKRLGKWRSFTNLIRRQMRNMWGLFVAKLATDIISNCLCAFVLYFSLLNTANLGLSTLFWNACREYVFGWAIQVVHSKLWEIGKEFSIAFFTRICDWVGALLTKLGFGFIGNILQAWLDAFAYHKIGAIGSGASFFITGVLYKLLMSGVMTLFSGTAFGLSGGTLVPIALGALLVTYSRWGSSPSQGTLQLSAVTPQITNFGTVSLLTMLLASENVCQIFGNFANTKVLRWCNTKAKNLITSMLKYSILLTVADMLVFIVRAGYGDKKIWEFYGPTRCELQYDNLLLKEEQKINESVNAAVDKLKAVKQAKQELEELQTQQQNTPSKEFEAQLSAKNEEIQLRTAQYQSTLANLQTPQAGQAAQQVDNPIRVEEFLADKLQLVHDQLVHVQTQTQNPKDLASLNGEILKVQVARTELATQILSKSQTLATIEPERLSDLQKKVEDSTQQLKLDRELFLQAQLLEQESAIEAYNWKKLEMKTNTNSYALVEESKTWRQLVYNFFCPVNPEPGSFCAIGLNTLNRIFNF